MAEMTPKEAVEIIKWVPLYRYECELEKGRQSDLFKALNNGLEALEKRIPKKVELYTNDENFKWKNYPCPCCKEMLGLNVNKRYFKFCPNCGQALDWSDRDE